MDCLEPPLDSVPIGEWFCVECEPNHINLSNLIGSEEVLMNLYERTENQIPGGMENILEIFIMKFFVD